MSWVCAHPLPPQIPGCRRWVCPAAALMAPAKSWGCRHPWQWATLTCGTPVPVPPRFPLLRCRVLPAQEPRCRQRPAGGRACLCRQHRTSCDSDVTQHRHLSIFNRWVGFFFQLWRWERERAGLRVQPLGFYAASGIFVLLVGFAGTSGKVLGAAGFSDAAGKEPRGAAGPGVPVAPSSAGDGRAAFAS